MVNTTHGSRGLFKSYLLAAILKGSAKLGCYSVPFAVADGQGSMHEWILSAGRSLPRTVPNSIL
jgi:hypothetical protein